MPEITGVRRLQDCWELYQAGDRATKNPETENFVDNILDSESEIDLIPEFKPTKQNNYSGTLVVEFLMPTERGLN